VTEILSRYFNKNVFCTLLGQESKVIEVLKIAEGLHLRPRYWYLPLQYDNIKYNLT